jgi:hypothetical protein
MTSVLPRADGPPVAKGLELSAAHRAARRRSILVRTGGPPGCLGFVSRRRMASQAASTPLSGGRPRSGGDARGGRRFPDTAGECAFRWLIGGPCGKARVHVPTKSQPGLRPRDRSRTLAELESGWPQGLPEGVIHADLFPDNVFFIEDRLSGLIDFYFACNDCLAYDVAICLNAWCFEADGAFNHTKGMALIDGYQSVRRLESRQRQRRFHCWPGEPRCGSFSHGCMTG